MQVAQHAKNIKYIRRKVGKAKTPRDHEKLAKEVTDAITKIGCNPNKIFYTINDNKTPNLSIRKAIKSRLGTRKIGAGEYGEIFYGCVDKECKKDIAIKIQSGSLTSEFKIGKMIEKLGGVNMYAHEKCGNTHIMYSEYANAGTLEDFIVKNKNTLRPIHYRFIVTQMLYNLYRIHKKYPSFRHSDLHAKNILMKTDTPTLEKRVYEIGKIKLNVENIGIETLITDYGLSTVNTITNPNIQGLDRGYGISPTSNFMYDAHLFLNALFLTCTRINNDSNIEVIRFIQRILGKDYLGRDTTKIQNFRLRLNVDHSTLPSFEQIFLDPFFLPYKVEIVEKPNPLSFIPKAKPIPKAVPKTRVVSRLPANQSAAIERAKAILQKKQQPKTAQPPKKIVTATPKVKFTIAPKGYLRINGKQCATYKKKDIVEIAKKAGIDTQGKTIEKICESLKLKYVK